MATLFLHIGLPKTATTSLQYLFESLEDVSYLGVNQPRGAENDPIYARIYQAANDGRGAEQVRREIENRLRSDEMLLLSEEMMTVSTPLASWETKLENLAGLLSGLDYKILVTVRNPVEAAFSYYIERFDLYRISKMTVPELIASNDDFLIFNYDHFFTRLNELFPRERLTVVPFEVMVEGDLTGIARFLGLLRAGHSFVKLDRYNMKRSSSSEIQTPRKLRLDGLVRAYERLGGDENRLIYPFRRLFLRPFRWLSTRRFGYHRVPRLSETDRRKLHAMLCSASGVLAREHGIDYSKIKMTSHEGPN